jgi:hypothetical protein
LSTTPVPTFRHPYASKIFPVVRAALLVSGRLSTEFAAYSGDRRSPVWELERVGPPPANPRRVFLRWGFAADITGPEDLDHGHVYVCLHHGSDSLALLCRCAMDRTGGAWRLDVDCKRPDSFLLRSLSLEGSIPHLAQEEALQTYVRRISAFFGSLPEVANTR